MYNKSIGALTTSEKHSNQIDLKDFHQQNDPYNNILQKVHQSHYDGVATGNTLSTNLFITQPLTTSSTIPTTMVIDKYRNKNRYRKNICGYITRKAIKEFTNVTQCQKVKELCSIYNCDYNDAKAYYIGKIQHITGPRHVPSLLIPEQNSEVNFKRAFRDFFQWFLKERYIRYLLLEGKMCDKKAYIQYKNTEMLHLIRKRNYPIGPSIVKKEEELSNSSSQEDIVQPLREPNIWSQVKLQAQPMIKMQAMVQFMPIINMIQFNSL